MKANHRRGFRVRFRPPLTASLPSSLSRRSSQPGDFISHPQSTDFPEFFRTSDRYRNSGRGRLRIIDVSELLRSDEIGQLGEIKKEENPI
jgi:hypothetical protein